MKTTWQRQFPREFALLGMTCLLAAMLSSSATAQIRFGTDKEAAEELPPTAPSAAPANPKFQAPQSTDVAVLVKFLTDMLSFEPASEAEAKAYQEQAPLSMTVVAQKVVELEKDEKSDNFKLAMKYLLAVDVMAVQEATPEEKKQLIEMVCENLVAESMDADDIDIAVALTEGLEQANDATHAILAYQRVSQALRKHKDPLVAELAQLMEGSAARLGLVGRPMQVDGTTVSGKPFRWSDYRGKVVLVDFWATWCGPCRAELPNIQKLYETYRRQGFEVVGISLDEDRAKLDAFLKASPLPWVTLHDAEGGNPTANRYGVTALPTTILVDRKGNVVSLNARGENLKKLLEQQIGPGTGG